MISFDQIFIMSKKTLVILAAGMGSRYGGLKQMDTMTPEGETIMDFSIYDAIQAGFNKVVFIIRESLDYFARMLRLIELLDG